VSAALRSGFGVDEEEEGTGDTLLLMACRHGHKRLLDVLVARGCNLNHQNSEGERLVAGRGGGRGRGACLSMRVFPKRGAAGNTALHIVCDPAGRRLCDPDGSIAAYLRAHGAGDLPNAHGMLPGQGQRPGTMWKATRGGE